MKEISNNLKNLLENNYLKLVKCFKITLKNNDIIALTEHSEDIVIDNINYISSYGFEENIHNSYSDLLCDNSEIIGLVNNDLNIDLIIDGKFDNATIEIFYINLEDDNKEKIAITTGNIKSIQILDEKILFNIDNVLNILNKTIGDVYSPLCRATFCDHKCSLNVNDYTFISKITYIKNDTEFLCDNQDIINKDKNYFKYGIITFTSGKNKNKSMEIKQSYGANIILNTKLNYPLQINDTFKIITGCDKQLSTCIKFNNAINFRGEPSITNTTKVYKFY